MKNSDVIAKYNEILESILINYIFTDDINDILWQAVNRYEEIEKLRVSSKSKIESDGCGKKYKRNEKLKYISKLFDDEIESYTNNRELIKALQDFKDIRNNIGKPFKTVNALTRLFNKLDKYSNNDDNVKIEILEKSILNNWQDIWELKRDNNVKSNGTSNKKSSCTYANTPTLTGRELEEAILSNNDLENF